MSCIENQKPSRLCTSCFHRVSNASPTLAHEFNCPHPYELCLSSGAHQPASGEAYLIANCDRFKTLFHSRYSFCHYHVVYHHHPIWSPSSLTVINILSVTMEAFHATACLLVSPGLSSWPWIRERRRRTLCEHQRTRHAMVVCVIACFVVLMLANIH